MARSTVQRFFLTRFVRNYDALMEPLERCALGALRRRILARASGRTLDLGAGTGANFVHFPDSVRGVVAVDSDTTMLDRARGRLKDASVPIDIVSGSADSLPFAAGTFDTVVAALVFCTLADPARAFSEIGRVLAPGGRVLLIEHVRPPNPVLGLIADVLTPIHRTIAAGCHLNRRTRATLERAGFRVDASTTRLAGTILEIEAVAVAPI